MFNTVTYYSNFIIYFTKMNKNNAWSDIFY